MNNTNIDAAAVLTPLEAVIMLRTAIQLHQECDFNSDHPALAQAMRDTTTLATERAATQPAGEVKLHKIFYWGNGGECSLESLVRSLEDYSKIMPVEGRAQWAMREAGRYIKASLAAPISEATAQAAVADLSDAALRDHFNRHAFFPENLTNEAGFYSGVRSILAAPVAQQEAKAEQVLATLHPISQVEVWADDYDGQGGHALIVEMLRAYAGLLKQRQGGASTEAESKAIELPPLPDAVAIRAGHSFPKVYAYAFTPDMMRSYGLLCRQAAPSSEASAPDCGACPGDGTICPAACKLAEESPPAAPSGSIGELPDLRAWLSKLEDEAPNDTGPQLFTKVRSYLQGWGYLAARTPAIAGSIADDAEFLRLWGVHENAADFECDTTKAALFKHIDAKIKGYSNA